MKKRYLAFILIFALAVVAHAMVPKYRDFLFEYDLTIRGIPPNSSGIEVWIPCPKEASYQKIEKISENAPLPSSLTYDEKYKNKIKFYSIDSPKDSTININLRYRIKRYEYTNKPGHVFGLYRSAEGSELKKFLAPSRLVTISPRVKDLAASITRDKKTDIEKARAIYDYVFENVDYDKTVPGWGLGDTERACDVRKGNCTDFHSLFISLARASGIPARFIIGVPIPEEEKGQKRSYHCWAEFYIDGIGWIPVDISEAWKDKSKYEYHFGTLDENRIELTQGRDIILPNSHNGEPLNYFVYPHVEIDGKAFDGVDVIFKFENVDEEKG